MFQNVVIRKGVVKGRTIELDFESGLPDGQTVVVGMGVRSKEAEEIAASDHAEITEELEADEAMDTIRRMRKGERSARVP